MSRSLVLLLALGLSIACSDDSSDAPGSGGASGASGSGAQAGSGGAGASSGSGGTSGGGQGGGGNGGGAGAGGTAGASGSGGLPECPGYGAAEDEGSLAFGQINEASGIVASREQARVLWVHNDSGDGPRVFAVRDDGAHLGVFTLTGAQASDWEDIAIGPGPDAGKSYLYLGDVGDNPATRPNIFVHRVAEPAVDPDAAPVSETLTSFETFTLDYPNGESHNCETLLVDPVSGDLCVVTKVGSGVSQVFCASAPLTPGTVPLTAGPVLTFGTAPLQGGKTTTGGDVSPSGDQIAIRTYNSAFIWRRPSGAGLLEAFDTDPCPIDLAQEPQGEAIGFSATEDGYYTVSEGQGATLWFYPRLP